MNFTRIALSTFVCVAFSAPAAALDFTMNFDNIPVAVGPPAPPNQDFGSAVLGYYNNDPVYMRAGSQPWDTTFNSDALAIGSKQDPDGQGNFAKAHSGLSAVGAVTSGIVDFGIAPGYLIAKMSFWYNAGGVGSLPSLQLYSGGISVYEQSLEQCTNVGSDGFCGWKQFEVPNAALAGKLITRAALLSTPNKAVFDDVALTTAPIPEPSTYALMLGGIALLAGIARRRKH